MSKFDFLDRFNKEEKLNVDNIALQDFATQVAGNIVATPAGLLP